MNKKKAKVETNITRNPSPPELTPRYMPQPYKPSGNPGAVFSNKL